MWTARATKHVTECTLSLHSIAPLFYWYGSTEVNACVYEWREVWRHLINWQINHLLRLKKKIIVLDNKCIALQTLVCAHHLYGNVANTCSLRPCPTCWCIFLWWELQRDNLVIRWQETMFIMNMAGNFQDIMNRNGGNWWSYVCYPDLRNPITLNKQIS